MPELSQLLVASFSCEPHLYFFTGRYSEPCRFRHHVTLGTLSLGQRIIVGPNEEGLVLQILPKLFGHGPF